MYTPKNSDPLSAFTSAPAFGQKQQRDKVLGTNEMTEAENLISVDRIYGALLNNNADLEESTVKLQYIDKNQLLSEIDIPVCDALYLLKLLEGINTEQGFAHNRQIAVTCQLRIQSGLFNKHPVES